MRPFSQDFVDRRVEYIGDALKQIIEYSFKMNLHGSINTKGLAIDELAGNLKMGEGLK